MPWKTILPFRKSETCRPRRPSRAGLVAEVIDIRTGRAVRDLEGMLAKRGRPMTKLEVVLVRFGVAISERDKQRRAANARRVAELDSPKR